MENGWIKLHRSLKRHWLFEDADMLRVWIEILLLASHKDTKMLFNGILIDLKRGSFICSKLKWSKRLKLSRQKLDRVLKMLESDQMIGQQTGNRCTLITVTKYNDYQLREAPGGTTDSTTDDTTSGHQTGNRQASNGQQTGTIKKDNKSKKDKNDEEVCVDALTPHELDHHFLPAEENAKWMTNPQFVRVGRRPIKKYPDMFLTPFELADVFEQLGNAGIPADQFKLVFMRVAARLMTYKAEGRKLSTISVYNWLIGWAKSDVVKELKASCDLQRSKVYLAGAKI